MGLGFKTRYIVAETRGEINNVVKLKTRQQMGDLEMERHINVLVLFLDPTD